MGAGKTSLAKKLANKLGLLFLDTDTEIEKQVGKSISEIFAQKGEHYFRSLESKFIDNLPKVPHIISCGGGLPCFNDNILKLKKIGKVLFLNIDFEFMYSRIKEKKIRPLVQLKSKEQLKELFIQRKLYYQFSDLEIDNSLSLNQLILLIN